jgi:DNA polymerase III subunit gamma/tau
MAEGHQSLYRRYRSQRFVELIGQDHVVRALRNAVSHGTHGHAYLFSGPRGTGKTSTARILAKALNCPALVDGEPCGTCLSCSAIASGTSFDVHELDAASNNGVDAIRDLIERANLGSPGRTKVYILDEVHMLSRGAEAALLKTLEEPPSHVVFVLATTDPQKVAPTIRSRCQPFEFHLISTADLERHVRFVIADAGLDVDEVAIESVLRQGAGSARDTLSALDQVAAAGGVAADPLPLDEICEALLARDPGAALVAVAQASDSGRDPRTIADALIAQLRNGFLALQAPGLVHLPDTMAARVADQAKRLGASSVVRAMEVLGQMLVEMRHAPDPRVLLEVALVRLANIELDTSNAALLERIERLERHGVAAQPPAPPVGTAPIGTAPVGTAPATPTSMPAGDVAPTRPATSGPGQARAALGAMRKAPGKPAPPVSGTPTTAAPASTDAAPSDVDGASQAVALAGSSAKPAADPPSIEMLTTAWTASILPRLTGLTRAMFSPGHFTGEQRGKVVFTLPSAVHRDKCESRRAEVEKALADHFGCQVLLSLVTADNAVVAVNAPDAKGSDHDIDVNDLTDAPGAVDTRGIDLLAAAFPGAEVLQEQDTNQ